MRLNSPVNMSDSQSKIIDLEEWKHKKLQERLEKIMLERYGSIEAELEAFLELNTDR